MFFTTLFGGGCVFPSGEDSMWLKDAKKKGLVFYVSRHYIGRVSFETSSWYTGRNEKLFYARGAYIQAQYKRLQCLWTLYYAVRLGKGATLSFGERIKWINYGRDGFYQCISFDEFLQQLNSRP